MMGFRKMYLSNMAFIFKGSLGLLSFREVVEPRSWVKDPSNGEMDHPEVRLGGFPLEIFIHRGFWGAQKFARQIGDI